MNSDNKFLIRIFIFSGAAGYLARRAGLDGGEVIAVVCAAAVLFGRVDKAVSAIQTIAARKREP